MGKRMLKATALPTLLLAVLAASWWAAAGAARTPVSNVLTATVKARAPSGGGGGGGVGEEKAPPPAVVTFEALPGVETRGKSGDGLLEVTVPAGAVGSPTTFTIALVSDPPLLPEGVEGLGAVYEVTAAGEGFQRPVALVFLAPGESLAHALVYYWDEALRAWLAVPTAVDPATGRLSVAVDHLTRFRVARDPAFPEMADIRGHWAEADILRLASLKVVEGAEGFFDPGRPVTRAEFAKMLCLSLRAATGTGELPPTDAVAVPAWAVPYVGAVVRRGLMTGYPDGTFRPLQPIRRDEAAAVLSRALEYPRAGQAPSGPPSPPAFTDWESVPEWARPHIGVTAAAGLVRGYPEPEGGYTFRPAALVTRAEAAAAVWRLLEAVKR